LNKELPHVTNYTLPYYHNKHASRHYAKDAEFPKFVNAYIECSSEFKHYIKKCSDEKSTQLHVFKRSENPTGCKEFFIFQQKIKEIFSFCLRSGYFRNRRVVYTSMQEIESNLLIHWELKIRRDNLAANYLKTAKEAKSNNMGQYSAITEKQRQRYLNKARKASGDACYTFESIVKSSHWHPVGLNNRLKRMNYIPTMAYMLQGAMLDHEIGFIKVMEARPEHYHISFDSYHKLKEG